ncbi:MAG: asparagine synthase [Clostridiales bacterium]|nr:asparagine synthase [Clostridiales bacterium]MCF8022795.1 asparagine synthase [Clostridiales bacterium]
MIYVSIQHYQYRKYNESPNCVVSGKAFYHDKLYCSEKFNQLVSAWYTEERFLDGIQKLNGFYALIFNKGKQLFAAVDRVRSIPLFYGVKGNDFYISDNAEWIRQQVGNQELDPLAKEEFLLTGYVTGPDTLFPDVKQLQAGEAIIVKETKQGLSINPIRYYRFVHEYEQDKNMEQLMDEHDQVLVRVFNRLIQVANGRTIVVPLSGGYDSRLIVLMLKRLGYENVVTFSYGRPGNQESEISRQVAESLGVRWEFVPYSNKDWYRWFNSEERKEYWKFACGFSSLGHIQDWPAVMKLREKKLISENSIFVPGHSADLPAGSRSLSESKLYNNDLVNQKKVINAILRYHFSLRIWSKRAKRFMPFFESRILTILESLNQYPDNASAFESWDIAERQAKFIINSLRVYEFWGYDWWIPFWDYEYMKFWCKVPLDFRINKRLYDKYVNKLFYDLTGQQLQNQYIANTYKQHLKNLLGLYVKFSLKKILRKLNFNSKTALINKYKFHSLAFWGRYAKTEREFLKIINANGINPNAINCNIYIKEIINKLGL